MLETLADRGMRVEEKFHNGRWLDLGQILVGETGHRAFELLDLARGLQCIVIGLVFDEPTIAIADRHNDQAEDACEQKEEGQRRRIGERMIEALRNDPM